jgi:hypothetical protein
MQEESPSVKSGGNENMCESERQLDSSRGMEQRMRQSARSPVAFPPAAQSAVLGQSRAVPGRRRHVSDVRNADALLQEDATASRILV